MSKYTIGVATLDGGKEVDCTQKDIDDIEARNARYAKEVEELKKTQYQRDRKAEYPDFCEYLDAIVKGDEAQKQKYIDDCLAVKAKYKKG